MKHLARIGLTLRRYAKVWTSDVDLRLLSAAQLHEARDKTPPRLAIFEEIGRSRIMRIASRVASR